MRTFIPLAALVLLSLVPLRAIAAEPNLNAEFSASVEFNSEEANTPKKIPVINFDGSILVAGNRLRVEVVNSITQEPTVAILDIDKGTAALLYPDNLNGERMPLGDDFRNSYLSLFMDFAQREKLGEVKGWKLATEKLDGGGSRYVYSGQSSRSVSFEIADKGQPHQLVIKSPKVTVTIRLSNVDTATKPAADQFSIPADFSMRDSDTKLADILPSL
ncbi:hypothetical protein KDL29_06755 [bacterium]|nr:hypothetical protein [bacterium]